MSLIIVVSTVLLTLTSQIDAQFDLPDLRFPDFGLGLPQPGQPLFSSPLRLPPITTDLYTGTNMFGRLPLFSAPSWPSPINRYSSQPPSPARQCRFSGACTPVDFGTTLAPASKVIEVTPLPPVVKSNATVVVAPSSRLETTTSHSTAPRQGGS